MGGEGGAASGVSDSKTLPLVGPLSLGEGEEREEMELRWAEVEVFSSTDRSLLEEEVLMFSMDE